MTDDTIDLDRLTQTASRYTANDEILRIERELEDLDNPALPLEEHPTAGTITVAECQQRIESEANSDDPRRDRIAGLNGRLRHLGGDA